MRASPLATGKSRTGSRGIFKLYIFIPFFTLFFDCICGVPGEVEESGFVCVQSRILRIRSEENSGLFTFISDLFVSQLADGRVDCAGSRRENSKAAAFCRCSF